MHSNSSRSGLFLMELIIAIMFFSLAGAVCTRLFVSSHIISNRSVELNHGILWAQNAAETFYGCNGDITQMNELLSGSFLLPEDNGKKSLSLYFDRDFNPLATGSSFDLSQVSFILKASVTSEDNLTNCAITVTDSDGGSIYELNVSLFPDKEAVHE